MKTDRLEHLSQKEQDSLVRELMTSATEKEVAKVSAKYKLSMDIGWALHLEVTGLGEKLESGWSWPKKIMERTLPRGK